MRGGEDKGRICAGTGPIRAASAPGLGPSVPHLRRDWAHPSHIGTGTGLIRHGGGLEGPEAGQGRIGRRAPSNPVGPRDRPCAC